ncbi:hypothetical protein ACFSUD_04985 [Sulfitobacter aestuarii]|uniref:Uncharacterized protein n=1 Tax=Sulfitobacter aestuarii TaxID=2161676 RepID=A0ABW5U0U8_9RHOB
MASLQNSTDPTLLTMPRPVPTHKQSARISLSAADRRLITAQLERLENSVISSELLLAHLLARKLAQAEILPGAVPDDLVTTGRRVTYMLAGSGARSGVLGAGPCSAADIPLASLLGATLIGMRPLQRAPLLRADGDVITMVVLKVEEAAAIRR